MTYLCRSSGVLEGILVESLPPHSKADKSCNARASDTHGKHNLDASHVAVNDKWLLLHGKPVADLRGTSQDEHRLADLRSVLENVSDHGVDKGRLSARYEESSAKALEEEKHAGRGSEVLGVGQCLNCNHGNLKGAAPASSGDDLVANPLASRCVDAHCVQEASSDSSNRCASKEERLVPASGGDQDTARNGREGDGNDERQITDTTHGWVGAVDRLEVDGDVVDGGEEATGLDKGDQRHDKVGALGKQLRRHHGVLALEPLDKCPSSDDKSESNEKANDDGRVPGVSDATVLDSQDEGDGNDGVRAGTETSGAETSDGSAGDEGFGVGGGAADDGAEFEDEDGDEKASLEREVLVDLSPCDEVKGGAIPASLVETLELIGDFGNGGGDDCLKDKRVCQAHHIKTQEKDTQHQSEHDEEHLDTRRLVILDRSNLFLLLVCLVSLLISLLTIEAEIESLILISHARHRSLAIKVLTVESRGCRGYCCMQPLRGLRFRV
ncbi:hypothetical protein CFAM422_007212 [Trichoderma lentiforme]|uniref:Uncharacterized protein n=1 Tax=Trichoderma lentiforme TaxID=1567552 RepID=A0A9P4XBB2_9HYPO|nr:hypothetical protein CFAM422_007212 [Trichoderma lentiforme]